MTETIKSISKLICSGKNDFCKDCFKDCNILQNPPNIIRVTGEESKTDFFFIFDKPNNNTDYKDSPLLPITILDSRYEFESNPTRVNLIRLLEQLNVNGDNSGDDPLNVSKIHITNAVKCDKCSLTGDTGAIPLNPDQVKRCTDRFLFKELEILKPKYLVFFGSYPEKYVTGTKRKMWELYDVNLNGNDYKAVRVPHTAPTPFNTFGKRGAAYAKNIGHLF